MKGLLTLLLILVGAALICVAPTILLPQLDIPVAFPHVQVPAEPIFLDPLFTVGSYEFYLVNSLPSVLLADLVLLFLAWRAGSKAKRRMEQYESNPSVVDENGQDMMVPSGWWNAFEAILEYFYNLVRSVVGPGWVRSVFPLVMTIFLFVLTLNWLHFLPGVDSVGLLHCAQPGYKGFPAEEIGNSGIFRLGFGEGGALGSDIGYDAERCDAAHHGELEGGEDILYVLAPFIRTGTTDMNVPLAIALIAVTAVQIFGVRALGLNYFQKFVNLQALEHGGLGIVQFGVGFLEIISEISRILSFTLRLFGNIFAGTVLLFVMMFLIPVGVPLVFFLLEVLIGLIQALVFAMLTLVLISVAMVGHGDHEEHELGEEPDHTVGAHIRPDVDGAEAVQAR